MLSASRPLLPSSWWSAVAADEENEQTCSISLGACQRSDADVGVTRKHSKKKKETWQEDLSLAALDAIAFVSVSMQQFFKNKVQWKFLAFIFPSTQVSLWLVFLWNISAVKSIISPEDNSFHLILNLYLEMNRRVLGQGMMSNEEVELWRKWWMFGNMQLNKTELVCLARCTGRKSPPLLLVMTWTNS